ncbi:MAG: hypothetical protein Ta2G_13100 [Termitinemataceae bacterium]|nr:MAG: hypothetical protein Ta2G_13100 [Termitinemataceae bacterium]
MLVRKAVYKPCFLLFNFMFFSAFPAFSANVSVIIVETCLSDEHVDSLSSVWESGIMDVLFESGHIVSNAQSIKIQRNAEEDIPEEVRASIEEAEAGGSEYFIMAVLKYVENNNRDVVNKPIQVTLKVISLITHKIIYKEIISKPVSSTQRDEFANAQKAAHIIMPYIGGKL